MAFDQLVALNVTDEAGYRQYREQMTPLLHEHGGDFRADFRIAEVLKAEASHPISRVFVISFPSREAHGRFFADPRYLAVRARHFERSVIDVSILAAFDR